MLEVTVTMKLIRGPAMTVHSCWKCVTARRTKHDSLQVGMFKRGDKSDWQQLVDKIENKRKMFADLLNDSEGELFYLSFSAH